MRTEGEHADTLWLETACSPLPRTQAYVCPIAEATLCYRTRPHSAILISTNEAYAGAAWWIVGRLLKDEADAEPAPEPLVADAPAPLVAASAGTLRR